MPWQPITISQNIRTWTGWTILLILYMPLIHFKSELVESLLLSLLQPKRPCMVSTNALAYALFGALTFQLQSDSYLNGCATVVY